MSVSDLDVFHDRARSNWVRHQTLVTLRWFAIAGQIAAILVGVYAFHLQLEIGLATATIGASILANLFSTVLYPTGKRLSEREATLILMFDLLQLGLLLYLTGGLNNPFALLLLAPVTIAATFLHFQGTALMGAMAILLITALSRNYLPLRTEAETILQLPPLFLFGTWVSLVTGVVFLGIYARQVTGEMHDMSAALLATQNALAREQKLTDLGGVVAAAAHELGTPLATIKLISGELLFDFPPGTDAHDDLTTIRAEADRCRDILRSMGRAGKDDTLLRRAPLETVVREAAEPHANRGKVLKVLISPEAFNPGQQPVIERRPEIIHGLRNLIQNAVDFSATAVYIEMEWTGDRITLRIADDGQGFPPSVFGRIGSPFVRRRRADEVQPLRPGYEGMGLGLFIAKTLLERSGARLGFSNGGARIIGGPDAPLGSGAIVVVDWPRSAVDAVMQDGGAPLAENKRFEA